MLKKVIQQRQKELGISTYKLAPMVGCNDLSLYNWFNGKSSLGSDTLEKILITLGIDESRPVNWR